MVGVVGLTVEIILALILVLHFTMNAAPSPSISSDPHNARPTSWNGYSPLARMFNPLPQDHHHHHQYGSGTLTNFQFLSWVLNFFLPQNKYPLLHRLVYHKHSKQIRLQAFQSHITTPLLPINLQVSHYFFMHVVNRRRLVYITRTSVSPFRTAAFESCHFSNIFLQPCHRLLEYPLSRST